MLTLRHMVSHDVTENNQPDWSPNYHKTALNLLHFHSMNKLIVNETTKPNGDGLKQFVCS